MEGGNSFILLLASLSEGLQVMKLDARILQTVNRAHQLIQIFDQVSLHDFQIIMLALLRSFLQVCIGHVGLCVFIYCYVPYYCLEYLFANLENCIKLTISDFFYLCMFDNALLYKEKNSLNLSV